MLRILDPSSATLGIDALGYEPDQKESLLDAIGRPYGMMLVTGPTGSGKTVSLYTCLNILNKPDVNISTAEDPAEINLPGVNQVNVNEKAGLTFAAALRAFLRQDPDVIMVGEIRDLETAEIAIKAAQTGHMVLSTLHTNDAPTTLTRLVNMGVPPFNIASSVILITAQRLARRLCSCKKHVDIPIEALLDAGFTEDELDGTWRPYAAVGCERCKGSGYKGRVGIYQVMPITDEMRRIIMTRRQRHRHRRPGAARRRARPAPVRPAQGQAGPDLARRGRGGNERITGRGNAHGDSSRSTQARRDQGIDLRLGRPRPRRQGDQGRDARRRRERRPCDAAPPGHQRHQGAQAAPAAAARRSPRRTSRSSRASWRR